MKKEEDRRRDVPSKSLRSNWAWLCLVQGRGGAPWSGCLFLVGQVVARRQSDTGHPLAGGEKDDQLVVILGSGQCSWEGEVTPPIRCPPLPGQAGHGLPVGGAIRRVEPRKL